MRAVPTDLAARLDSGAASLCHAWILTRADGVTLGFTDHDRDLVVDGATCRAATGWTAGAHDTAAGFAPGLSAALGALDDAAVTAGDLEAGLYDGASVECLRVDWSLPTLFVRLWTGRTFGRLCDAVFGDARCGVAAAPGVACDKRWRTCVETFANGVNFRGFPTAPGEDFLTLYPSEGERHDGGKR